VENLSTERKEHTFHFGKGNTIVFFLSKNALGKSRRSVHFNAVVYEMINITFSMPGMKVVCFSQKNAHASFQNKTLGKNSNLLQSFLFRA